MEAGSSTQEVTNMDKRLYQAVTSGSVERLESFIQETTPDILQQVTPLKHTCIHLAARFGGLLVIQNIHRRCPSLFKEANSMGETPLHIAARAGHLDIVTFLIDCAKNSPPPRDIERGRAEAINILRKANRDGNTLMHEAVLNCHIDVVKLLIREDPELLSIVNHAGVSPLYMAIEIEKRDLQIVWQILGSPNVSYNGKNGRTALHAAVIHQRPDMAELLLRKTPGLVKDVDYNRRTPLHFASALGFLDSVKMLLMHDISTSCFLDEYGSSPVHLSARFGRVNIIKEFIRRLPDILELRDERCRNILHIAVESMQVDVVEYILKEEAHEDILNGIDMDGNTPLHLAAMSGNPCIVILLLQHKRVDKMAMNIKGDTGAAIAKSKLEENDEPDEARLWVLLSLLHKKWVSPYHDHKEFLEFFRKKRKSLYPEESAKSLQKKGNTLMVVAVLIVTVTFAAAFTLPGGYNGSGTPNQGRATLKNETGFKLFLAADIDGLFLGMGTTFALILLQFIPNKVIAKWIVNLAQFAIGASIASMTIAFTEGVKLVTEFEGPSLLWLTIRENTIYFGGLIVFAAIYCWIFYQSSLFSIKRRYRKFGKDKEKVSSLFCYDA